jgi:pyruvate dehydrogenase E2 component (dihydrolipoamide acetyltransferase)
MAEIRMPKMGDGMEEGTINVWLKHEGDQVKSGEPIAEVETDKANVEISAYETGTLTKIVVKEGETVPVGAVIAHVGEVGAAVVATAAGNGTQAAAPVGNGAVEPAAAISVTAAPANGQSAATTERVKASPLARRMMAELALDAAQVHGTGPGGRIVERDVKAFMETHKERALPQLPVAPPATPVEQPVVETPIARAPAVAPTLAGTEIKPSRMRDAIARRTVQSKQNIPHFYVTMLVEMDRAMALLKDLNADATDGKVTVNDLIVKTCAIALGKVPAVNATWTPEGVIRYYAEANIGIAVGIDEGLIIPVVRDCQTKTLRQISAEAKQLIGKARNNQLKPEEYSGGTFSVSNLGMMGVDVFTAIINPPEAAILAIGGISRDPVVVGDTDQIVIRSRMKVTLSADHRLLDGVVAAKFLQEVKKLLEAPFSLLS